MKEHDRKTLQAALGSVARALAEVEALQTTSHTGYPVECVKTALQNAKSDLEIELLTEGDE